MKTYELAEAPCPNCRSPLGAITSVCHNDRPLLGALSVCFECGALLQLTAIGLQRLAKVPDDADDRTRNLIEYLRREILAYRRKTN